jgi:hypothetical protein
MEITNAWNEIDCTFIEAILLKVLKFQCLFCSFLIFTGILDLKTIMSNYGYEPRPNKVPCGAPRGRVAQNLFILGLIN